MGNIAPRKYVTIDRYTDGSVNSSEMYISVDDGVTSPVHYTPYRTFKINVTLIQFNGDSNDLEWSARNKAVSYYLEELYGDGYNTLVDSGEILTYDHENRDGYINHSIEYTIPSTYPNGLERTLSTFALYLEAQGSNPYVEGSFQPYY